jgi:hypothetical protein
MSVSQLENKFLDLHGREVHAFSMQMANVGFHRMADLLGSMLQSEAWRSFKDGLGTYAFLPGEFDYFLTSRGITREDVMKIPDVAVKAKVEEHMDERRTGEEAYRRPVLQVRVENPQRPGQPIEPFGLTEKEAKSLLNGTQRVALAKPPLGDRVRRYTNTGGTTTKTARDVLPLVERLRRSAMRLDDNDMTDLIGSLKQELRRRAREAS